MHEKIMAELLELSLSDVIESEDLPITVRVTRPCILKQEEVLKMHQYLTIINRRLVQLIFGKDLNGKKFRINTDHANSVIVETVDIFYPKNVQEVLDLSQRVTFIQLKNKFGFGVDICEIGERFVYSNHSEHINSDGEKTLSFIREADSSIVHLPIEALLKDNLFVFVFVKEKLNLQTLLLSFQPQSVCFTHSVSDKHLPSGVVSLESVSHYDLVLSATITSPETIHYELFPLDKRIMVKKCTALPQFVQMLGDTTSKPFQNKIEEILFLMFFDIYAGRFYGSVNLENPLKGEDLYLVDSTWFDPTKEEAIEEKPTRRYDFQTYQHDLKEEEGKTAEPIQFARQRPTTLLSSVASMSNYNSEQKFKNTSVGSSSVFQNDKDFRSSSESDSDMAFQIITDETGIVYMTDAISQQQKIIEGINQGKKPIVTPDDLRDVPSKTPTRNVNKSLSKSFENENPLYGFHSPELPKRKMDDVFMNSKQLPENQLRRKKGLSPFSSSSFASQDESDILSKGSPESERPILKNQRGTVFVPLNDLSKNTRRSYSESQDDEINYERSDSGIDSPDIRKSLEDIYKTFEKSNSDKNVIRSGGIDSTGTVKQTVPVAEKIKQLENNIIIQVQGNKKSLKKQSQSFGEFDMSRKLLERRRSNSEPGHDYAHLDTLIKERPKSFEFLSRNENPYAELIYAQIRNPPSYGDIEQKKEVESLNEIRALDLKGVGDLLTSLGLGKYKTKFEKEMLKGDLLYKINESAFHEEIGLTKFEARKLYRYIHGWRVCHQDLRASSIKYANIKVWSVENVRSELTGINLKVFAKFCAKHDVDGHFLNDFLENPMRLESLSSHGVNLSSIESERFRLYANKELDYDEEEKKIAVATNCK